MSLSARRWFAAMTALIHGGLAVILSVAALAVVGKPSAAPVFLLFFGVAAVAAWLHAFPQVAERHGSLRVRPGTLKAVACFVAASLHWMVALAAILGLFMSDAAWRSVPMFFGTVATLLAIAILFMASGYFLYSLERLTLDKETG